MSTFHFASSSQKFDARVATSSSPLAPMSSAKHQSAVSLLASNAATRGGHCSGTISPNRPSQTGGTTVPRTRSTSELSGGFLRGGDITTSAPLERKYRGGRFARSRKQAQFRMHAATLQRALRRDVGNRRSSPGGSPSVTNSTGGASVIVPVVGASHQQSPSSSVAGGGFSSTGAVFVGPVGPPPGYVIGGAEGGGGSQRSVSPSSSAAPPRPWFGQSGLAVVGQRCTMFDRPTRTEIRK